MLLLQEQSHNYNNQKILQIKMLLYSDTKESSWEAVRQTGEVASSRGRSRREV